MTRFVERNILAEIEGACNLAELAGTNVILSHKDLRWLLKNRTDGWMEAAKQLNRVNDLITENENLRKSLAHEHSMRGWYK